MVFLGIGSNLSSRFGDRFKNIDLAVSAFNEYGILIKKRSGYYESLSYPNKENPKFINIVIEVETHLPPEDLASVLIFIEKKLDRSRTRKNEPRTCDIDIIDYKHKILNFEYNKLQFKVPHNELVNRNFVLIPLREILPKWEHPETRDSIDKLIDRLSDEQKKSILKI